MLQVQWTAGRPLVKTGRLADPPPFNAYVGRSVCVWVCWGRGCGTAHVMLVHSVSVCGRVKSWTWSGGLGIGGGVRVGGLCVDVCVVSSPSLLSEQPPLPPFPTYSAATWCALTPMSLDPPPPRSPPALCWSLHPLSPPVSLHVSLHVSPPVSLHVSLHMSPSCRFTSEDVNREEGSDLTLHIGPTPEELSPLHLHKDVLAAHSGVVAAMLSTQHEIEIPGVAMGFVERIMRGVYRGDLLWIWVRTVEGACPCMPPLPSPPPSSAINIPSCTPPTTASPGP